MHRRLLIPFAAFVLMSAAPVGPPRQGYLDGAALDLLQSLPPAPVKGDARYKADRTIFKQTRAWRGTPRWALATNDIAASPDDMMRDFSCAVGIQLSRETAPRLRDLVAKAGVDTSNQTNAAKRYYRRLRPFQIDRGEVCQPKEQLANSFDYPSGHATLGWTWAMILADVAPDRATPILARARAYGESRIVCGAHNASAVEAGALSAAATMAVVRTREAFNADLEKARAEVAALRRDPGMPRPQGCDAEEALIAQRIL